MITTIFFDLDGTLIDQKAAQNAACLALYHRYGFDAVVSEADFLRKWDHLTEYHYDFYLRRVCTYDQQRERRIADLFAAYGVDTGGRAPLEIYAEYLGCFEDNWRPFPEIRACLERLQGYQLCVLTNGDPHQQQRKLERTELAGYFAHVICAGDHPYAKPDLRLFQTACAVAGVRVAQALCVGDSYRSDIAPCLAMGMPCVLIDRGGKAAACSAPTLADCTALPELVAAMNKN